MPTAHLVHGFNVSDGGARTTGQLAPHFQARDFTVQLHSSKWRAGIFRDLLSVRFGNRKRAEKLAQYIQPGDTLVGHSNGCAIIAMALWLLAEIEPRHRIRVVWFNPALDADTPLSPIVCNALVFHTRTDRIVQLSKFLLWHRWGSMGRIGYQGQSGSKVQNCAYENIGLLNLGHSGIFRHPSHLKKAMQAYDDWTQELDG